MTDNCCEACAGRNSQAGDDDDLTDRNFVPAGDPGKSLDRRCIGIKVYAELRADPGNRFAGQQFVVNQIAHDDVAGLGTGNSADRRHAHRGKAGDVRDPGGGSSRRLGPVAGKRQYLPYSESLVIGYIICLFDPRFVFCKINAEPLADAEDRVSGSHRIGDIIGKGSNAEAAQQHRSYTDAEQNTHKTLLHFTDLQEQKCRRRMSPV